ncbi:MAG: hypothetical protein AAGC55_08890, partial [Myxococcota bacterium]
EFDLYLATRPAADEDWTAPSPDLFASINGPCKDGSPNLSQDGLVLSWASPTPTCADPNALYIAIRSSTSQPFGLDLAAQDLFSAVNGGRQVNDQDPWLSADGSYLVMASDRGGNGARLYQAVAQSGN